MMKYFILSLRNSLFISMMFLGVAVASAAMPELQGCIIDIESGEPLAGAIVQGLNSTSRPLTFTSSDSEGRFVLKIKKGVVSILIRCLGYENIVLDPKSDFSIVRLSPSSTQLRDVIVKAPDIYAKGDTLVFNVDRYTRPGDDAIIDIIKRLPGIKVEDDGTIKYQGKPINKFYIDGNDFIGGNYGLATENISHKDVKSVEVMENHQAIKALEGIEFPEEAGINLKLKEDARSRWVGLLQGGSGATPLLYDATLYAMRIAPKIQNICTFKTGNTGWNPALQMTDHSYDDLSLLSAKNRWPEYISADIINSPLAEIRTRDNNSWLAASVASWSVGDISMRLKLNYLTDRLKFHRDIKTDYFSTEIPEFIENNTLSSKTDDFSIEFHTKINRHNYYLNNRFTLKGIWDSGHSSVSGSLDISQRIWRRKLSVNNGLSIIRRNERGVISITSHNSLFHAPDHLAVIDAMIADQSIATTDFRSLTKGEKGWFFGRWKAYVISGIDINYRIFRPRLSGMEQYDNSEKYKNFLSTLSLEPRLDYDRGIWRLSLSLPVKWQHYSINGNHDFVEFSPSVSAYRQLTAKSDISASINYRLSPPAPHVFIDAPILRDYRNLLIARAVRTHSRAQGVSLTYRYRNPLRSFFANISVSLNRSESPLMADNIFEDAIIISTFLRHPSTGNLWSFNSGISKGFCHGRIVVGTDVTFNDNSATSMRNSEAYPYHQQLLDIRPYFKGSLTKWLSVNYNLRYNYSGLKITDSENSGFHSFVQIFMTTLTPHDRINLTLGMEHYMTRFVEGGSARLLLMDTSVSWQFNRRLRFTLTARNLSDSKFYDYSTYGTLSNSEYSFRLRPRNILLTIQYRI